MNFGEYENNAAYTDAKVFGRFDSVVIGEDDIHYALLVGLV
jgi:hypothetical protein